MIFAFENTKCVFFLPKIKKINMSLLFLYFFFNQIGGIMSDLYNKLTQILHELEEEESKLFYLQEGLTETEIEDMKCKICGDFSCFNPLNVPDECDIL
jgi:hypothetical protein